MAYRIITRHFSNEFLVVVLDEFWQVLPLPRCILKILSNDGITLQNNRDVTFWPPLPCTVENGTTGSFYTFGHFVLQWMHCAVRWPPHGSVPLFSITITFVISQREL